MEPRTLKLFCWIRDVSLCPFRVDIGDDSDVTDLKNVILTQRSNVATFANIGVDQLILWKVSGISSLGQSVLITLTQDLHPGWHPSSKQERNNQTRLSRRRRVARHSPIIRLFPPSQSRGEYHPHCRTSSTPL